MRGRFARFAQSQRNGNRFTQIGSRLRERTVPRLSGRYRVATVEDRVNYLISAFCKLDLEKQQELLAVAGALERSASRS
jgi:hypothetical protein